MGNKNKTVSFRVNEDAFVALQEIAEERDISLSSVFRDYVDMLVAHDGEVAVLPEDELGRTEDEPSFPPTVEVSKSFVREHERLELESEHLREQVAEYREYVTELQDRLEGEEEVLLLDDLDADDEITDGEQGPYRLG
ncbi:CopG family transcriptional regulator [Saliphagus sp. LR7]|uniref:CopG family transcriptional regulator n=1 Tax=Saliphagus sp. LR7 TaxID=2282654 RepID=UPI000DF85BEA|nr:CopG family transcriptional regulator [Saliphagus sp. LR7]